MFRLMLAAVCTHSYMGNSLLLLQYYLFISGAAREVCTYYSLRVYICRVSLYACEETRTDSSPACHLPATIIKRNASHNTCKLATTCRLKKTPPSTQHAYMQTTAYVPYAT